MKGVLPHTVETGYNALGVNNVSRRDGPAPERGKGSSRVASGAIVLKEMPSVRLL